MQTKTLSILEVGTNYVIGFVIAWFIQAYFLRWMGFPVSNKSVTGVTLIFTVVSIFRSYIVRRVFNKFK